MEGRGNEEKKWERKGGREGRFSIFYSYSKTLNISLIVRGKAIMKDPNEDSTLTFAVRSLKLFSPFWVKFTFRRSWDSDGKYFNVRNKINRIFSGFNHRIFCKGILYFLKYV